MSNLINLIITIVFLVAAAITKFAVAHAREAEEHIKEIAQ